MVRKGFGRIVLTISGVGLFGVPGASNYGAAKAGMYGLMRSLVLEGAEHGIGINAFWPSAFTRMVSSDDEINERMKRSMPVAETVPAAMWLCHPDCTLNGEVIHAGSGRVSRVFVAETVGYIKPGHTLEELIENRETVLAEQAYMVHASAYDSNRLQSRLVEAWLADNDK
jgi:hypothetical protein